MSSNFVFAALILLSGLLLNLSAHAQCKVLDIELAQGHYQGDCKNGLAHGFGEVTGDSYYRGEFKAGHKHGYGIKVMSNGDRYEGQFDRDFRHGYGIYQWQAAPWTGNRYEGEYVRDKRHGEGTFYWSNGDRYDGQWENDLRLGLSAMESRRYHSIEARKNQFAIGDTVCTTRINQRTLRQPLYARISDIHEDQLTVTPLETMPSSIAADSIDIDERLTSSILDWSACHFR